MLTNIKLHLNLVAYFSFLRPASGSELFDTFTNIILLRIFPL